jgi:phage baseplate assembly protein W
MRPTFGAGLSDLVFEPTDETYFNDLADQIRNSITIWDNRVIVQTVSFIVDADHSTIIVKMIFAIRGYEQIFEHSTNLTGV